MDTIFRLSLSIESCNWIDFISVAYASLYHWNCGRTQRKAATINQLACSSYSLYVQLLLYAMYFPGGMKARVSPVQWSKPYSILAPTQDSNPGGRAGFKIISGDHYTTTAHVGRVTVFRASAYKFRAFLSFLMAQRLARVKLRIGRSPVPVPPKTNFSIMFTLPVKSTGE